MKMPPAMRTVLQGVIKFSMKKVIRRSGRESLFLFYNTFTFFLYALSIRPMASALVTISAMGKVSHTIHAFLRSEAINKVNTRAIGRTNKSCLQIEIISDEMPQSKAWKIPWRAMLMPANTKPIEII